MVNRTVTNLTSKNQIVRDVHNRRIVFPAGKSLEGDYEITPVPGVLSVTVNGVEVTGNGSKSIFEILPENIEDNSAGSIPVLPKGDDIEDESTNAEKIQPVKESAQELKDTNLVTGAEKTQTVTGAKKKRKSNSKSKKQGFKKR